MRNLTIIALAAAMLPGFALASASGPAGLTHAKPVFAARATEEDAPAAGKVRVAASQTIIPANGAMPEHVQSTARYILVVSGRVRVSNLDTGAQQDAAAGDMVMEPEGQRHTAHALDGQPASVLLIEGPIAQ